VTTRCGGGWGWRTSITSSCDARQLPDVHTVRYWPQEIAMRKWIFRFGWVVLFVLPVIYAVRIFATQDLPKVELWQWAILFATVVVIYFSRNTDEVLKHRVV